MTEPGETPTRGDEERDERDLLVRVVVVGVAVLAAVSALEVLPWTIDDIVDVGGGAAEAVDVGTTIRLAALSFGGMALGGAAAGVLLVRLPVLRWARRWRVLFVVGLGLMIGAARTAAVAFALPGALPREYVILETALGAAESCALIAAALYYIGSRRRIRAEERLRIKAALLAERTRRDLEEEELRVRREVSHRLHGGLQQRMVLVNREIEDIRDAMARSGETERAAALTDLSETLDEIRESEVRAVAHELYPLAAEIDLPSALLLVMDRLPASVELHLAYEGDAEALYAGSTLPAADRVLLYSIVEEAATNAVRHGGARNIWVTLGADDGPDRPTAHLVADDDGTGLADDAPPSLSGLGVLQARVRARGGDLTIGPGPRGGARLALRLPLEVGAPR